MKTLFSVLLFSTLSVSGFAFEDCHETTRKKVAELAKQEFYQNSINVQEFQWLISKLEVAASYAEGNGFSCVSYDSDQRLNSTVVIQLKSQKLIPNGARRFLNRLKR